MFLLYKPFKVLAPQVGFEPTTDRLTADCSTTELLWNNKEIIKMPYDHSYTQVPVYHHSQSTVNKDTTQSVIMKGFIVKGREKALGM